MSAIGHNCLRCMLYVLLLQPLSCLQASANPPLVVVMTAQHDTVIEQVPLTGTITSAHVARLSTEVSGMVEKVNIEVGDQVDQGRALIELDRAIEQHTMEALQAATLQGQAELTDARRRLQDAKRLRKQKSLSENEMRLLEAEVEVDAATLKQKQAQEHRQQVRVERHTLRAPFSGVISERLTEIGEWIEPRTPVLTLVAVDDLRVEFHVPQEFYSQINRQTTVNISLDAIPDREFDGVVAAVVPVNDASSRTFLIHVRVNSGDARMTHGMSVKGRLHLPTGRQEVVISRDAIVRYPDGRATVWVVNSEHETPAVSEKRVTTGHSFDSMTSIREGVQAGDVVIVEGNESLKEGQQVRVLRRE